MKPTSTQVGSDLKALLQACGISYVSVSVMRRQLQNHYNLMHEEAVTALHAAIEDHAVRLTDGFMLAEPK